jgi:hypothetical protein
LPEGQKPIEQEKLAAKLPARGLDAVIGRGGVNRGQELRTLPIGEVSHFQKNEPPIGRVARSPAVSPFLQPGAGVGFAVVTGLAEEPGGERRILGDAPAV